jgi:6-phosphogluconolactonase
MNGSKITRRSVLKLGGAAAVTAAAGVASTQAYAADTDRTVYIGNYGTRIVKASQNITTGALAVQPATNAATINAPSWIARAGNTLYAIGEYDNTINALEPADLRRIGGATKGVQTGAGPAHVLVDPAGRYLYTSLYDGGATVLHPITNRVVGKAAEPLYDQGPGSNAHQAVFDPTGKYVLGVDLGRSGVFVYALNSSTGKLTSTKGGFLGYKDPTYGLAGCRHLVFHPNGKFVYLANELNGTISICAWSNGKLQKPSASLSANGTGPLSFPGEITVSADGRFVYVTNRDRVPAKPDTNTIGVFAVSADGAKLTFVDNPSTGGLNPRHLTLDPAGTFLYVANQGPDSDPSKGQVNWFSMDAATGLPQPGKPTDVIKVPGAAQVLFA